MKFNVNSNQEAFDKAVAHFATARRVDVLRDADGGRDAIGALVTCDQRGDKDALVGRKQFRKGAIKFSPISVGLIHDLRAVAHDDASWEGNVFVAYDRCKAIAADYDLSTKVVSAIASGAKAKAFRRAVRDAVATQG